MIKFIFHFIIILFLTVLTQIGGLIYLLSLLVVKKDSSYKRIKIISSFTILYLVATFFITPYLSPLFGRVKIKDSSILKSHSLFTKLCNRNYVKPELNETIIEISEKLNNKYPQLKLIYLDANFPFLNDFPLLPHLSHSDGKKIDISFIYNTYKNQISNLKPSNSGYGVFEKPNSSEKNQTLICKQNGFWQYDFTKYLTFGKVNSEIQFSNEANKFLINLITKNKEVSKVFIEPHLKQRLNLKSFKIRFHGCRAVRHDDHIHFQIN